jgi:hypothetical protein
MPSSLNGQNTRMSADVKPGVMILANNIQLQKAVEPGAPPNLMVDAARVNPAQTKKR